MSSKSKPKPRRRAKQLSPEELQRRRSQRNASIRRLLLTREQTGHVLGGVSISTVIRLEREGRLTPIKLHKDAPTAQTFYAVQQVEALAGDCGGRQ